jgi:hypothetical protein
MNEVQTKEFIVMQEDIRYIKGDIAEIKGILKDFSCNADKKYSPMAAWNLMKWIGGIIGSILVAGATYVLLGRPFV